MAHRIVRKKGDWLPGLFGGLAILAAIALVTGLPDADVRAQMPDVLAGCGVALVVGAALYFLLRAQLVHVVEVQRGEVVLLHRGRRVLSLLAPELTRGTFRELVDAGVARRVATVAWVSVSDRAGRRITVRKALGVHERVPDWPPAPLPPTAAEHLYAGDPTRLHDALARA